MICVIKKRPGLSKIKRWGPVVQIVSAFYPDAAPGAYINELIAFVMYAPYLIHQGQQVFAIDCGHFQSRDFLHALYYDTYLYGRINKKGFSSRCRNRPGTISGVMLPFHRLRPRDCQRLDNTGDDGNAHNAGYKADSVSHNLIVPVRGKGVNRPVNPAVIDSTIFSCAELPGML